MELRPADAIVVLGAAVWQGGEPSPTLLRRAHHAISLFLEGLAPVLVLSGGLGRNPPTEAKAMRDICRHAGICDDVLLLEERSTSTFENVQFSADLLWQRGASSVIVVSDDFHLPRATMCFRYLGFDTQRSAAPRSNITGSWHRRLRAHLRELVAQPAYRIMMPWRLVRRSGSVGM
ncbi:MAG: YdcF family protein [Pseudomonadota bacterium]